MGSFSSIEAQIGLPDEAALPAGKDAWVIDQFYHSNVINGYAAANQNNTRILVQSDGAVFRRRIIQYSQFANDSGWCRDQFTKSYFLFTQNLLPILRTHRVWFNATNFLLKQLPVLSSFCALAHRIWRTRLHPFWL
jgi:hypothetical protein